MVARTVAAAGWNAAELARRLQVPSGTISRWMTGERQPSSRSCDLLADVLGVDLDLVLTLAGHRPGPEMDAPDDQRAAIVALLERINLTPDRAAGLQGDADQLVGAGSRRAAGLIRRQASARLLTRCGTGRNRVHDAPASVSTMRARVRWPTTGTHGGTHDSACDQYWEQGEVISSRKNDGTVQ